MKKLILVLLCVISSMFISCINDEPDYTTTVIKIENTMISYWDIDNNHWHCREALIYTNGQTIDVKFPILYEGEIVSGTKITYHCYNITAYYKNGKKIFIDWNSTKLVE